MGRLTIDVDNGTLSRDDRSEALALYSREAFEVLSRLWLKVGWGLKYSYTFTWLGQPIIQLPEDLVRVQEVIWRVRPDVIVETGVARGGSLLFYASLLQTFGGHRVVGIDVEIRSHNRHAIEGHELGQMIELIEGDSAAPETVAAVEARILFGERVLVVLDSNHSKEHVLRELEAYHPLVSPGSYLIAADGIMQELHDVPGGCPEWAYDNPAAAAREFAARHPEFVLEPPPRTFSESVLREGVSYWPEGWLRRREA